METEIVVALIALAGSTGSVVVSIWATRAVRAAEREVQTLRVQADKEIAAAARAAEQEVARLTHDLRLHGDLGLRMHQLALEAAARVLTLCHEAADFAVPAGVGFAADTEEGTKAHGQMVNRVLRISSESAFLAPQLDHDAELVRLELAQIAKAISEVRALPRREDRAAALDAPFERIGPCITRFAAAVREWRGTTWQALKLPEPTALVRTKD